MDPIAAQEFYWLHLMNMSLGIVTVAFMVFFAGSLMREIMRHLWR